MLRSEKFLPGARLPSTLELAAMWKTTPKTVHRALTTLVKEGLLKRYPNRGTFVCQREEKLTCVGVYGWAEYLSESLFSQTLLVALKEELTRVGIEMDVWLDPRSEAEFGQPWQSLVKAATNREFQGLIVTSTDPSRFRWQRKIPVPTAYLAPGNVPNHVGFDFTQFAELSVRALAQQGCRSIGLIVPGNPADATEPGQRSLWMDFSEHFLDLACDLGMTVKNEWMGLWHYTKDEPPPPQDQFGYEEFLKLWNQPQRPDGLVVYPDSVARGVILALREQQVRVPAELKLALHKNEAVHLFCPLPATFVVSSEAAVARALVEQVQKQFRGERCEPISLPFQLMAHSGSSQRRANNQPNRRSDPL